MKDKLYEAVDVWRRVAEKKIVCYRCFRVLPDNMFCVQSVDSYDVPVNKEQEAFFHRQFTELLSDDAPDRRSETYSSLEEAIAAFDRAFEGWDNYPLVDG